MGKSAAVSISMKEALGPELVALLACISDQPDGVAEVALSALPHASLMRLIAFQIIEPIPTMSDAGFRIEITRLGEGVIREYAHDWPADARTSRRSAARAALETEIAARQSDAAAQASDESKPPETSAGLRPLRTVWAWFGRQEPTVADQLVVGLVATIVGGVIAALIVLLISTSDGGSHTASISNARGATHSVSTPTAPIQPLLNPQATCATVGSTSVRTRGSTVFVDSPGQLEGGGYSLEGRVLPHGTYTQLLHVAPRDQLEMRVQLFDTEYSSVQGVVVAAGVVPSRRGCWKLTAAAHSDVNPGGDATFGPVLILAKGQATALTYRPGSTRLLDQHGKQLASLPDGVLGAGVSIPFDVPPANVDIYYVTFDLQVQ
ncbi:MAG: hypothetical protein ACLP50_13325 [Solirubrobacteraceae bacterium]